jgi:chromate reductase, NAD(P)H dehydrogenase (quinone)
VADLDILVICGSLRKGSYNAALARTLPSLAPPGMKLRTAPSFAKIPIYNFDDQQATGFPPDAVAWADAIRSADGIIVVSPEYNWSIPGGLKNAIDWVSRMKDQPFKDKPAALQSCAGGILAAQKFDEKTLELKDQTAIDLVKQQLAGFEKFVRRVSGKG